MDRGEKMKEQLKAALKTNLKEQKNLRTLQGFLTKKCFTSVKTSESSFVVNKIDSVKNGMVYCKAGKFKLTDIKLIKQGSRMVHL